MRRPLKYKMANFPSLPAALVISTGAAALLLSTSQPCTFDFTASL